MIKDAIQVYLQVLIEDKEEIPRTHLKNGFRGREARFSGETMSWRARNIRDISNPKRSVAAESRTSQSRNAFLI